MTIEIKVTCDGRGCCNEREINDYCDRDVEQSGYSIDHRHGGHYCHSCWPEVKKEIEEDEE